MPATAWRVFQGDDPTPDGSALGALPPGRPKINLKGIGIGNGLTVPEIQYKVYRSASSSTQPPPPSLPSSLAPPPTPLRVHPRDERKAGVAGGGAVGPVEERSEGWRGPGD